jgi:hypothetical protein
MRTFHSPPAIRDLRWCCLRLPLLAILLGLPAASHGQRADTLGIDGVYHGTIGMQLSTQKGKEYNAPARFVFLPDGKSALLTAQHPDGVLTVILKGELRGSVFLADSEGRLDYGGYHQAMKWDIAFEPKTGTAVLHGKVKNLPKWAREDDLRYTFRKQSRR